MHTVDINLDEISKIEGSAGLDVHIEDGKVQKVNFKITEYKRFYTQAIRGKPVLAVPQLVARICGTCSNAHLLCSIKAIERALGLEVSPQTKILRTLTAYGLMIRDHGLHLYLFALPDLFAKDSLFDLDENIPAEHVYLDDAFAVKAAGNHLSVYTAGRSVHGPYLTVGGFNRIPEDNEKEKIISELLAVRPAVLRLIEVFTSSPFDFRREVNFVSLAGENFGFLDGKIINTRGQKIEEKDFGDHLIHTVIPYSQASGYTFEGQSYIVGALARINLTKNILNKDTQRDAAEALKLFPSNNIFHNNLAQAIEILHCIDHGVELLKNTKFVPEVPVKMIPKEGVGVGAIEAPRGTLYYRVETTADGKVKNGQIVVPTGQNQISIERDLVILIQDNFAKLTREQLIFEIEKLIRAYDPCMSCAAHFLKVRFLQKGDKRRLKPH